MASSPPAVPLPVHRLAEPLLRKLSDVLDRAPPGKGWRDLAQLAGSHGGVRLSQAGSNAVLVLNNHLVPRWCMKAGDGALGIKVMVEPESQVVFSGQMVKLSCWAAGYPLLHYQWFKKEKEVPHGNSPELVFNQVHAEDAGFYICRVNSDSSYVFSRWAQLDVCDLPGAYGNCLDLPENKIHICLQPQSQNLIAGEKLVLQCEAIGTPVPQYQWYRNGSPLTNGDKKVYLISSVDAEHQGTYWCQVYNDQDNQESKKVNVVIEDLSGLGKLDFKEHSTERQFAIDKVALLMGNMSYFHHPKLKAPLVDVYELTNLLRQLDFKVVSLLDLTEPEMRNAVDEFLLLLDKGVYGLLYYAGHGYENYGNSFMVPIDAPNPYRAANCLCVQNILKRMQEKETGLNVFLLDMCRKRNEYDNTVLILDALKVTANIVFGYATCQGAEAFEIQQSGLANGIFMKFLKERLLEDKKITVLLDGVAEDMGKCHLTKGKQALEIRSSLSEKRALTDPIQQTVTSAESLARNLQWAKAHELPESMCLQFKCGVQIQLGFAAEFSNVMIVYTRIVKKPPEITVCKAYVTDFPLEDLTFTVCLHYEYAGVDDVVDERKVVNIGKPLIAKLCIHQGFRKNSCFQSCCGPNGPCFAHLSGAGVAKYCPTPHQPHSFAGFCQPSPGPLSSVFQPARCHCNTTPNRLFPWQSAWPYSNQNIPVETTDDTEELESNFSQNLRLSHQQ
ncbi:hypothetical protein lerEdw1_004143 [Lerista edwardsae]|nr:hypothetical protein lerEdw1_004143 [Lerista edwardsae]